MNTAACFSPTLSDLVKRTWPRYLRSNLTALACHCAAALIGPGQSRLLAKCLWRFSVPHTDFESLGKLDDLLDRDITRYKNVFIDESHRFRTETTQSYEMLAQICRGKRVILVSATPLNNTPRDILSQIKLFQNGKEQYRFRTCEIWRRSSLVSNANLKGLDRQRDREQFFATVQANAKATREQILKFLMIRRTRTEIAKYYGDDLREQDLKFPDVTNPEPLFYKFNKRENEIFNETIGLIGADFICALPAARLLRGQAS